MATDDNSNSATPTRVMPTQDLDLEPIDTCDGGGTVDPPPPSASPCPDHRNDLQVCLTMKRLPEAVAEAQAALVAYNAPPLIFQQDGELVRLTPGGNGSSGAGGPGGALVLVSPADLRCDLAYAARWYERAGDDDGGLKPIFPPPLIVHDLMRRAAAWAPPLRGVVRFPVFGNGWRLLDAPGYHADDGLYYAPDHATLPPVPDAPDDAAVAAARALICDDLLGQFPFAADGHGAAAVAALLVPFVRHRIEGATPLHLFDSPQPGTGKTLLADVVSIPALGREPAANTEIANGDELRKWVTAMALAGEGVVLIDNVNARL